MIFHNQCSINDISKRTNRRENTSKCTSYRYTRKKRSAMDMRRENTPLKWSVGSRTVFPDLHPGGLQADSASLNPGQTAGQGRRKATCTEPDEVSRNAMETTAITTGGNPCWRKERSEPTPWKTKLVTQRKALEILPECQNEKDHHLTQSLIAKTERKVTDDKDNRDQGRFKRNC